MIPVHIVFLIVCGAGAVAAATYLVIYARVADPSDVVARNAFAGGVAACAISAAVALHILGVEEAAVVLLLAGMSLLAWVWAQRAWIVHKIAREQDQEDDR